VVSAATTGGYAVYAVLSSSGSRFSLRAILLDPLGVHLILTLWLALSGCLAEVLMVVLRWINVHGGKRLSLPEKGYFAGLYSGFAIANAERSSMGSGGVTDGLPTW
jgi:hypothetical protein